jgi:hypothetical protein
MWWMFTSLENFGNWIGTLVEMLLGKASEKIASDGIPSGRPKDVIETRRRLKGDMAELHTLYTRLNKQRGQAEETCNALCSRSVRLALESAPADLTSPNAKAGVLLCHELLAYEGYYPIPQIDFQRQFPLGEIWELTETVRAQLAFYENPKTQQEIADALWVFVHNLLPELPARAEQEAFSFVPLVALLPDPAKILDGLIPYAVGLAGDDGKGLFRRLGKRMSDNFLLVSGIDRNRDDPATSHKKLVLP